MQDFVRTVRPCERLVTKYLMAVVVLLRVSYRIYANAIWWKFAAPPAATSTRMGFIQLWPRRIKYWPSVSERWRRGKLRSTLSKSGISRRKQQRSELSSPVNYLCFRQRHICAPCSLSTGGNPGRRACQIG